MATKDEQALIGRAMMESTFRKRLLTDPDGTVKAEGIVASDDFMEQFRQMDEKVADDVGRLIGAMFSQDPAELKEDEAAAVVGGVGLEFNPDLIAVQPTVPFQPPFVAPTTW